MTPAAGRRAPERRTADGRRGPIADGTAGETHRLGRLAVEAAVADLDMAMALRPRLEALCRDRLPGVVERVCAALAPPDLDMRIGRIELDLGVLLPDHIEEDLIAALEAALSERLAAAILSARRNETPEARSMTKPEARLRRFEAYLVDGTLPLPARGEPFNPLERLLDLAEEQPDALIAMLRSHATAPLVLERLVRQLGERGLQSLLTLLAPADAVVIAGLLHDVITVRQTVRPPDFEHVGEAELRRRVWVTSLEFLLRDQGSQFNRRRFLRHLLEREARRAGIGYAAFLRLMAEAAERAARRSSLRSSLPRTLAELVAEFDEDAEPGEDGESGENGADVERDRADLRRRDRSRIDAFLSGVGSPGAGDALVAMASEDPEWLAERLRQRAREAPDRVPALIRRLLNRLAPSQALDLLEPERGEDIARQLANGFGSGSEAEAAHSALTMALLGDGGQVGGESASRATLPDGHRESHSNGLGDRLDREARLERWLAGDGPDILSDTAAPDAAMPEDVPVVLAELSVARLSGLLLAGEAEDSLRRLSRVFRALGPRRAAALARRLMPWMARRGGALAPLLSGRDRTARVRTLLRLTAAMDTAVETGVETAVEAVAKSVVGVPEGSGHELARKLDRGLGRPLPEILRELAAMADHARSTTVMGPAGSPDAVRPRLSDQAGIDTDRLFAWLDGMGGRPGDGVELARHFALLADRDDPALRAYLAANRMRPAARARWAALLPLPAMGRLVGLLVPAGSRELIDSVMLIGAAWRHTAPFGARRPDPRFLWSTLLDRIAEPRPVDLAAVLDGLMDSLTGGEDRLRSKLALRARHLAREGGYVSIGVALRRASRLPPGKRPAPPAKPSAAKPPTAAPGRPFEDRSGDGSGLPLYIANAGLVLFNPHLPVLFERLGLLAPTAPTERSGIADLSRGVHLLQYLADGRLDAPEPDLVINKLLCGRLPASPVERSLDPSPADLELCDGLIRAVLDGWPPLRNSTPAALRETFLQREGRLRHKDGAWHLQVQRKTLDVLVDQLPWGVSVIYHRWMKEPMHVAW
ncbi:contractile injection system tape measure protein [Azospirillum largimobile]